MPGTYTITDYTDGNGNAAATVTRTVVVEDTSAPVITLIGDTNVTHEAGSDYTPIWEQPGVMQWMATEP